MTYRYRREDGTEFTVEQPMTDDPLEECPETGQPVERVVTGGMGFQLKGEGWYRDGYEKTQSGT
jgi:putative FmdB family regulatory protein